MDLDSSDTAAPAGTVLLSDGADGIISVPVAEGVDQVVLNSDQTTYIIQFVDNISDAHSTGGAVGNTEDSGGAYEEMTEAPEDIATNIGESAEVVKESAQAIEESAVTSESKVAESFAPCVSSVTSLADQESQTESVEKPETKDETSVEKGAVLKIQDTKMTKVDKTKTKFGKALNLEPSNAVKARIITRKASIPVDSEIKNIGTKKIVDEEDDEDVPETPRRMNRRSIKKPKRFGEDDISSKKDRKTSVITIPAITKKSLGLKDILVEIEIEESLFVSSLTKAGGEDGMCKYVFRVSKNEISEAIEESSEQQNKSIKQEQDLDLDEEEYKDLEEEKTVKAKKGGKRKKMTSLLDKSKVKILAKQKKVEKQQEDASFDDANKSDDGNDKHSVDSSETNMDEQTLISSDGNQDLGHVIKIDEKPDSVIVTRSKACSDKEVLTDQESDTQFELKTSKPNKKKKKVKKKETMEEEQIEEDEEEKKDEKPKRKYTKRNIYQRDHMNYTVKKSDKGKYLFKCLTCGVESRYQSNIADHVRTHTGEKPFQCKLCPKAFSNQSNLNGHMSVHKEDRPFECHLCHFKFKIKRHLTRHMHRHSALGTHTCQLCGKQVYSSYELKKHLNWHSGEKNFECDQCGKKFLYKTTLMRHEMLHTGIGKHQCEYCGASFQRRDYFKAHLQKRHNTIITTELCNIPSRNRTIESQLYYASTDPRVTSEEVETAVRHIEEGGSIMVIHA